MLHINWIHSKSERQGAVNSQWVHASVDNNHVDVLIFAPFHYTWIMKAQKERLKNTGFGP